MVELEILVVEVFIFYNWANWNNIALFLEYWDGQHSEARNTNWQFYRWKTLQTLYRLKINVFPIEFLSRCDVFSIEIWMEEIELLVAEKRKVADRLK